MKTIHLFKTYTLIQGATLIASLIFSSSAFAAYSSYLIDLNTRKVTDLGSLGGGNTVARAINDAGQVVGESTTVAGVYRAFITGPDGMGMVDIKAPGSGNIATGINATGQVVGYSDYQGAFITGPNGENATNMGADTYLTGNARINASGQVAFSTGPAGRAYITGPNGVGRTALGNLGGGFAEITAINDAGQVVGASSIANDPALPGGHVTLHAFITGPNGVGMTDLGAPGGVYSSSGVSGINNAGQVVGNFGPTIGYGESHAFITGPNGVGMTELGTLGGHNSFPDGINDSGQVVGGSEVAGAGIHAFITGPNGVGVTDLNSLVSLPAGVVLSEAIGINNRGQVIAFSVPEPASYVLMTVGLGLLAFMANRRKQGRVVA